MKAYVVTLNEIVLILGNYEDDLPVAEMAEPRGLPVIALVFAERPATSGGVLVGKAIGSVEGKAKLRKFRGAFRVEIFSHNARSVQEVEL